MMNLINIDDTTYINVQDVYEFLEHATIGGEDIANELQRIVLEEVEDNKIEQTIDYKRYTKLENLQKELKEVEDKISDMDCFVAGLGSPGLSKRQEAYLEGRLAILRSYSEVLKQSIAFWN